MMSVHLTVRGQEVMRQVLPSHFQWMAALMAPLAENERKTLVRLLAKISQRAKAPKPEAGG
jgi:DNA-binding MarR family transcriptional regulator